MPSHQAVCLAAAIGAPYDVAPADPGGYPPKKETETVALLESMKKGIGKYVMIVLASFYSPLRGLGHRRYGRGHFKPNEVATVGGTKITNANSRISSAAKWIVRAQVGNIDAERRATWGLRMRR